MVFGGAGDAVKSFRFSLRYRPHLVVPAKRREDYSPDELVAFQAEFERLWKRRRKRLLPFYAGLGVWAVGMIAAFLLRAIDGTSASSR